MPSSILERYRYGPTYQSGPYDLSTAHIAVHNRVKPVRSK